jgi:hypothetical protein
LIAEYPRTNSKKIPLPVSPQCSDFTRNGAEGTYFSWEELSGHLVDVRRDANGEIIGGTRSNPHDWAIVRDLLRDGLDRIWEATGGVRLTAAYRNPARNEHIRGAYWVDKDGRRVSKSDAHIWGLGADVKPLGSGTGPMARPDWDALQAIVLAPGPGGAVWREEFEDAPDHLCTEALIGGLAGLSTSDPDDVLRSGVSRRRFEPPPGKQEPLTGA